MNCFYDMREDETQTSWQRAFNHDVKDEELVWHRDENDRIVKVISGVGWKFQFDNELPMTMEVGKKFENRCVEDRQTDRQIDRQTDRQTGKICA